MKKLILIFIFIILVFTIKNLIYSMIDLSQNGSIVTSLRSDYEKKRRENAYLQQRLYYVQGKPFIEREAREKLGLVKNGEFIVLVPASKEKEEQPLLTDSTPNWKKWLNLFL